VRLLRGLRVEKGAKGLSPTMEKRSSTLSKRKDDCVKDTLKKGGPLLCVGGKRKEKELDFRGPACGRRKKRKKP